MNTSKISRKKPQSFVRHKAYLHIKRALDLVLASALLVFLALPMILIAVAVRLDSRGAAVFAQKRVGRDGKSFTIYKFRTMYITAPPDTATSMMTERERHITRVGAVLRRTSLDELPQLYNVILGDMSLVGCRPLCESERELNERRLASGVLSLRPGITGLAQVSGRDDLDEHEKLRYDADYTATCSFSLDAYCLWRTVFAVLGGRGAR